MQFTESFTLVRTRAAQGAIADASGWTIAVVELRPARP
jgi:hypothetical protein